MKVSVCWGDLQNSGSKSFAAAQSLESSERGRQQDSEASMSIPPIDPVLDENVCPEERAGLVSLLTFSWITPLLTAGYLKPLEFKDFFTLAPADSVAVLSGHFQQAWRIQSENRGPLRVYSSIPSKHSDAFQYSELSRVSIQCLMLLKGGLHLPCSFQHHDIFVLHAGVFVCTGSILSS